MRRRQTTKKKQNLADVNDGENFDDSSGILNRVTSHLAKSCLLIVALYVIGSVASTKIIQKELDEDRNEVADEQSFPSSTIWWKKCYHNLYLLLMKKLKQVLYFLEKNEYLSKLLSIIESTKKQSL
jgi:hypothetical protein